MSLHKPIAPLVMPSDLAVETNGAIPAALLSPCGVRSGYSPFAELKMHHLAARAMRAMMAAAIKDGHDDVRATGTGRTYQQQVTIFDGVTYPKTGRYLPEGTEDIKWATPSDVRSWDGQRWRRKSGTAMAAIPGTSNHGWWLAIDFSEEYDGNPFTLEGITEEFTRWLIANAARFGFSAEAQSEDWHWRYIAGDNIPQAVLDYERPPLVILPDPPLEADMKLCVMTLTNTVPPTTFLGYGEPAVQADGQVLTKFWSVYWIDGTKANEVKMLNDQVAGGAETSFYGEHVAGGLQYLNRKLPSSKLSDGRAWAATDFGSTPNLA